MGNNIPVISLFNRDDILKVLEYPSKFPFRPPTEITAIYRKSRPDRYASMGLINEQGANWAMIRNNITPKTIESRKVLRLFLPTLNEICDDFVDLIRQKRRFDDNLIENFTSMAEKVNLEINLCLLVGRRHFVEENGTNLQEISKATKNILNSLRESYYGKFKILIFLIKTFNSDCT